MNDIDAAVSPRMGNCAICLHRIDAGASIVRMPEDEIEGFTEAWAHRSCVYPATP